MRTILIALVISRKGKVDYHLQVEGRAAHAGNGHHTGVNAVVQMADLIQKIAQFTDYDRDITFNVGAVQGGTVVNRVPHFAEARIEMRAFDLDVFEEGLGKMLALNDEVSVRSASDDYPSQITLDVLRRSNPWPKNKATQKLFAYWKNAGDRLGKRIKPEARGGLSDGNGIWQAIPTLDGLGPAGGNAHCSERSADGSKDQEYVLRESFVPKALLNTLALLDIIEASN